VREGLFLTCNACGVACLSQSISISDIDNLIVSVNIVLSLQDLKEVHFLPSYCATSPVNRGSFDRVLMARIHPRSSIV
jgi:uncharacterized cysteine cluster protein YcgN (CxxCxxCC family)